MTEARTGPDPDCASLLIARKLQDFKNDGMSGVQIETGRFEADGQSYLMARLRVRAVAGAKREIDVGYPIAPTAAGSIPLIGLTGLFALGTIFAFGCAAHRSFERRMTMLNRTFERFVSGERGARAPRESVNDELSELGRNLNASLDRIQGLVDEQQRFNQQIAHDFRRPLAGVLLDVGEILEVCHEGATRELLQSVRDRISDLRNTFDRAIEPPADEFLALNLSDLMAAVVRDFVPQAHAKGLQLKFSIELHIWTLGSRESLTSLFANLIDNAIKYTPHGIVRAELATQERSFDAHICDTGPGLEEHLAKELLQPFKRGAQVQDTAGHGLGLTFVVNSVLRHGFAMRRRNLGPGLEIAISGPILPPGESRKF